MYNVDDKCGQHVRNELMENPTSSRLLHFDCMYQKR